MTACPGCGSHNLPQHRFCGRCGRPIVQSEQFVPPSAPRHRFGVGMVVAGTLIGLATAGGLGLLIGNVLRDGGAAARSPGERMPPPSWSAATPPPAVTFTTVEAENISVEVPTTWEVMERQPISIVVRDPESGGVLLLRSGTGEQAFTLDGMQEALISQIRQASASLEICTNPTDAAVPAGPVDGRYFAVCSVGTPAGAGPGVSLVDGFFIGLEGDGRTIFVMRLTAANGESWEVFDENVAMFVAPTWRLMTGNARIPSATGPGI